MGGPAHGDRSAVLDGLQWRSCVAIVCHRHALICRWKCDAERARLILSLGLRIHARSRNHHQLVHHRRRIHRQVVHAHAAQRCIRVEHRLPLQRSALAERLPRHPSTAASRTSPNRSGRAPVAPRFRCASRVHIRWTRALPPGGQSAPMRRHPAHRWRIRAGSWPRQSAAAFRYCRCRSRGRFLRNSQAQSLLRLQMGHVCKAAVVGDPEDAPSIARQRQQSVRARGQRVDNLVFSGPKFTRRLNWVSEAGVSA